MGLTSLLRRTASDDKLLVSENEIGSLGLHASIPPKFSALGFGNENSNIHADDIATFVKSIGYREPWKLMNQICGTVGISTAAVRDDLINFLRQRNQAAHSPAITFTSTDVEQSARTAFEVAFCFDVLCSHWVAIANTYRSWALTLAALSDPQFKFRFLDEGLDGKWRERIGSSERTFRIFSNDADALREAGRRSAASRQILVVRNTMTHPQDWRISDNDVHGQ